MSIGDFAAGFTQSISDQLTKEREAQRKREDEDIAYQQEVIKSLMNRPDFRPEHLGRALHDLMDLSSAKAGQRKQKKGTAGFYGATELPASQLLQGIMDSTTPMYDAPMPTPPTEAAGMEKPSLSLPQPKIKADMDLPGIGKMPQPTGEMALAEPIPVPPKGSFVPGSADRLVNAAHQMQDYATRPTPLLYSPDEMAHKEGHAAGIKAGEIADAQKNADVKLWRSVGMSDEQIQDMLMKKYGGRTTTHTEDYVGPDGKIITVWAANDGTMTDLNGKPVHLDPSIYRKVGISSPYSNTLVYDDAGRVTIASTDRNTGSTSFTPAQGVRGRTSPAGPVVQTAGPGGTTVINRLPRSGTGLSPVMEGPPTDRQQAQAPLSATDQTTLNSNLTALSTLRKIQEIYSRDPQATARTLGPVAGRIGAIRQVIPLVPTDPRFNEIQPYVSQFTNMMIKAITGAQMSEPEATRLKGQLPQMTDKPEVFDQKLKSSIDLIGYVARAYIARGRPIPQELADAAQEMGIAMPNTNVPGAGGKTVTRILVDQYAKEHGIAYQDAANLFTARGYTIH